MKKPNWKQSWALQSQLLRPNDRLPRGIQRVAIFVEEPPEAIVGKPLSRATASAAD